MKRCYKCKESKDFSFFSKSKETKDGFSKICKACNSARGAIYRANNKKREKLRHQVYQQKNREKVEEYHKQYYILNRQKYYENCKKWAAENNDRMKELWRRSAQKPENKRRHRVNEARRRATKFKATPKWLSEEQLAEIRAIYDNCPPGYHVDHIVPLKGKNVTGLHVPWNLQYLTPSQNHKKNNKLILE